MAVAAAMPAGQVAAQRTLPEQLPELMLPDSLVLQSPDYVQRYPAPQFQRFHSVPVISNSRHYNSVPAGILHKNTKNPLPKPSSHITPSKNTPNPPTNNKMRDNPCRKMPKTRTDRQKKDDSCGKPLKTRTVEEKKTNPCGKTVKTRTGKGE
jgi:hypothetical protein